MNGKFMGLLIGVGALIGCNVVAAGVVQVLGQSLTSVAPGANAHWWPWVIIGLLGVAASIIFINGLAQIGRGRFMRKGKAP